jgi:sortase A
MRANASAPLLRSRVLVVLAAFVALATLLCALMYLSRAGAAGENGNSGRAEVAAEAGSGGGQHFAASSPRVAGHRESFPAPRDRTLRLTVPKLARVNDVPVAPAGPAAAADERSLREGALHVRGTGFPWQPGANTYIAGHRLGFPGTKSNLLFWDLDELEKGDRVLLKDAAGRVYEYAVFREMVVGPKEVRITLPVPAKSVVSLQTCTLPTYEERLVVQAELVGTADESEAGG